MPEETTSVIVRTTARRAPANLPMPQAGIVSLDVVERLRGSHGESARLQAFDSLAGTLDAAYLAGRQRQAFESIHCALSGDQGVEAQRRAALLLLPILANESHSYSSRARELVISLLNEGKGCVVLNVLAFHVIRNDYYAQRLLDWLKKDELRLNERGLDCVKRTILDAYALSTLDLPTRAEAGEKASVLHARRKKILRAAATQLKQLRPGETARYAQRLMRATAPQARA